MTTVQPSPGTLAERLNAASLDNHHGWLGFVVSEASPGLITGVLTVRPDHLNPAGGLHGGVIASLADSLCGYGSVTSLPVGASGFTTLALNATYLGGGRLGDRLDATARLVRGGRRVQNWAVALTRDADPIAEVAVTQLVLYPRHEASPSS